MGRNLNTEAREKILEVAYQQIYKKGFNGISMEDIAEAAGIKKANLFHYYPTKQHLGLAVFEYVTRGFQDCWASKLKEDHNPEALISQMFDDTREKMGGCGCAGGCFIGNMAQELSDSNEDFRQKVAEHFQAWARQLTTYFARLQASGYFKPDFDPQGCAQAILSLYEGAMLFAKATRQAEALENAKKMAIGYLTASKYREV